MASLSFYRLIRINYLIEQYNLSVPSANFKYSKNGMTQNSNPKNGATENWIFGLLENGGNLAQAK